MAALAKEGLDYFLEFHKRINGKCIIAPPDGEASIALNAFILLTLLEVEDYPFRERWIEDLYQGLAGQQREDGGLNTFFGRTTDKGKDFYPGEALTAIAAYAKKKKSTDAYAILERAFPYYSKYFRESPQTAFVPWQSQAYTTLYLHTKDRKYADFVFEMNHWIIDKHQILQSPRTPDSLGGFRSKPNFSSAAFLEGLACAFHLAKAVEDQMLIDKFENSTTLALRFCFQLQYDEHDVYGFKNPQSALGGIRTSLTDTHQRIDMSQHFMHALLLCDKYRLTKKH